MSETRDGQRRWGTSNPCSEPIASVAAQRAVTPDQVAEVMWKHQYHIVQFGIFWQTTIKALADLFAAADPAFDREEFLRRCGV